MKQFIKIRSLVLLLTLSLLSAVFIHQISGHGYKSHLSTNSLDNLKELNNAYGFSYGEDLLHEDKKSYGIASLLKNDVLQEHGETENPGLIIKFANSNDNLILMSPEVKIDEETLWEIAEEYEKKVPEIEFVEPDIKLNVYSVDQSTVSPHIRQLILRRRQLEERNMQSVESRRSTPPIESSFGARINYVKDGNIPVVGIADSGVDLTHYFIEPHVWNNKGEIWSDGIDNDNNDYVDDAHGYDFTTGSATKAAMSDNIGHGTHIAGIYLHTFDTLLERNEVHLHPSMTYDVASLKVFDKSSESRLSYLIKAINYARINNIRVVNISAGTTVYAKSLEYAANLAKDHKIFLVAAVGNSNTDTPHYPAAFDSVIGVGGLNPEGNRHMDSNYGDQEDVSAPAQRIVSSIPNDKWGYLTGTSQSAPFVSAHVAYILMEHPNISLGEMVEELKKVDFMQFRGPTPDTI